MATTLNRTGAKYARSLITRGKVDRDASWSFSAADADKLLGSHGDDEEHLAKYHLGISADESDDPKAHFLYPFGKDGKAFRDGITAAKALAEKNGDSDVVAEAAALLAMLSEEGHIDGAVKATRGDMFDWRDWQIEKMQKTPDGSRMLGRATVTNIGVFRYPQADGTVMLELRHPDDVFDPASLASLEGLPLTNDHPSTGVNPENFKFHTVGSVFSPRNDAYHVTAGLAIADKQAMADVQSGKRALSCGYDCELVPYTDGYMGMPTTHRQKRIRYNHVAIVDMGRAGPAAKLRMDSTTFHSTEPSKGTNMKKIRLDHAAGGAEAEVEDLVAVEIGALKNDTVAVQGKLDAALVDVTAKQAALDAAEGKVAALEATKTELEGKLAGSLTADAVEALVQSRVALLNTAKGFGIKVEDSWTDRKIRESVVSMAFPTIKLDGKSAEFLDGVFDSASEALKGRKPPKVAGKADGSSHESVNLDTLLADARAQSTTNVQNAWKGKE
jgi:hypothetical protein